MHSGWRRPRIRFEGVLTTATAAAYEDDDSLLPLEKTRES